MEERLLPLNGLLALLEPHDPTVPLLYRNGFRLQALEVPMTGELGKVVVDAVLFHPEHSLVVLCECKSGANIEPGQARRYAAIDAGTAVNSARISLPRRVDPVVDVLYSCQGQHLPRIKQGLSAERITCTVIGVSPSGMIFDCPPSAARVLREALQPTTIAFPRVLPRLIGLDHDSPRQAFEPAVMAQLVVAMAHRRGQASVRYIAEQAVPHLALYGHRTRVQLVKKVGEAARAIASAESASFLYQPPQAGDQDGGIVHLLRSPEDNDPRGRTQGYQALMRGSRVRRRKSVSIDPGQLDLLRELAQADDEGGDDVTGTGEEAP
ncbi:hypothetical protein ACFFSW_20885 [Saccharothrix longispora]|uniref:Uncharacterized protein n=1 Tax=Saccharothrix longispora TaxID=33920 RepID=A0ABU1Q4B0_9PSEU|nr:hypothetical protein [Saccharothrix longispora]MDR6597264.1 hypothetical protein [Saccharothrix longispora]